MQCNIEQRGRKIRAFGGVLAIMAGLVVLLIAPQDWLAWIIAPICILGGLFQLFEAWKGWCALRAMGIWTPW